MQINVQVESPKKNQRKLTITIPAELVDAEFGRAFVAVQKKAKIKGFREGHVPLKIVKQKYGHDVQHEVLNNLLDQSYQHAVTQEKLRVVSRPQIVPANEKEQAHFHANEGQPLSYIATVEVFPEFEPKAYTGLSVKKDQAKVTDQEVDQVVNNLLDSRAELLPLLAPRPAKKGDFADIQFEGGLVTEAGLDKKEGMSGQQMLELGSDRFIPGFEEQLIGVNIGETKTFRISFPKDYSSEEFAGKEAEFTVTLNEVKSKKLPELTDDFAKEMKYESVLDMKVKTRDNLTKYKEDEVNQKLRNDVLEELIAKNKFEVPESMVQAQAKMLAEDMMQNLQSRGFQPEMAQKALVDEQKNIMNRAETQVRAGLLLDAISKKENIQVEEKHLDQEMDKMAKQSGGDLAQVKDFYTKNPERLENLEFQIREQLTIDYLVGQAKVK